MLRKTIVLVEDDLAILDDAVALLETAGHKVMPFKDADSALNHVL